MGSLRRDSRVTPGQSALCGGLAGLLGRSLTAPLEVVKVLAQVGSRHAEGGFVQSFPRLYRAEGGKAFWKGNGAACARLLPSSALQLCAYRRFLSGRPLIAGSLAGMVAAVVTYPADVIETRLIVQNTLEPSYRGILHAFCSIYYQEGFLALYKGVSLTMLGAIPFSVGSFLIYINLDKIWQEPSVRFTPFQNFINGCLAAGVAQTFSFPFETVKRKMQIQSRIFPHCGGTDVHFTGIVDCFQYTVKTKGVMGLWSGLTANLLKIVPYFVLCSAPLNFASGSVSIEMVILSPL